MAGSGCIRFDGQVRMGQRHWSERFADRLLAVGREMRACWPQMEETALGPFYGMLAYHLGWSDAEFRPVREKTGKMLRPLLCLLGCEAVGGDWPKALPAAAAVELLHNFTLIHDDIEDHSDLRRGRPTVWCLWGVSQAINAGDGLFTLAHLALLRLRERGLPAAVVLQAVEVFDRAILRICEGQFLDISFAGRLDIDERAYTEMIAAKTAALLEAALHLGALVGEAGAAATAALRAYGHSLGLAFQVQDDLLGVWGQESQTGKPAAADIVERKLALPIVYALDRAGPADRALLAQVYQGRQPPSAAEVGVVLEVLERVGARTYLEQVAARYHAEALAALEGVPSGPAREALREIAESLVGRDA